nr:uncharacterized protein LOC112014276 [Quercus suber]POF27029.1 uncharacterized protein CFP56_40394 [Quercus suber]
MERSERSLSLEEQAELARSNKKVKNVSHAGFCEGHSLGSSSPTFAGGSGSKNVSFKDKLMGEIPGAYTQAFCFEEVMDDDAESDDEVETLRQGMVAVKFSKELKQEIRRPWVRALIVKVYGRVVGLNFLQAKLLSMWKPAGRLDVVDLEHGFFLVRLSLREDVEHVLGKGPWFIGDHFLSVRPWEPDFKPESANVASIAVWIRLSGLPIEYYNAKALQHIGKAIGNVLRIDTFTATESRGKFARLCIQVDVNKPLVTTVMIGKLQQSVTYEGIHNLCFECGRLGHRKELCPFVVRPMPPCKGAELGGAGDRGASSHVVHAVDDAEAKLGPHGKEHDAVHKDVHEELYGPWVVVARRKKETKIQRNGGTLPDHGLDYEQRSNGQQGMNRKTWAGVEKEDGPSGLNKETKRKLSPVRFLEKARLEQVIHRIGIEAQPNSAHSLNLKGKEPKFDKARKANSVKGMKAAARAMVGQNSQNSAAVKLNAPLQGVEMRSKELNVPVPMKRCTDRGIAYEASGPRAAAGEFQFAAVAVPEMGQTQRGSSGLNSDRIGREVSNLDLAIGSGQLKDQEGMEEEVADSIRLGMENSDGLIGFPGDCSGTGEETQEAQFKHGLLSDGSGGCVAHGADKMDLEGGGDGVEGGGDGVASL